MKLTIDESACTGHGRCYSLVPELFDADDYGHGVVLVAQPGPDQVERAKLAEQNCPERAITLDEGTLDEGTPEAGVAEES